MPAVSRRFTTLLAAVMLGSCAAGAASAADKGVPARSPADRVLSPAQARECIAWGKRLGAQREDALKAKAEADTMRAQIGQSGTDLKEEATTLDRTGAEAVAAYNAKVDARDKAIDALEAKVTAYNTQVADLQTAQDAKDKSCAQRRYDERDLANPPGKK